MDGESSTAPNVVARLAFFMLRLGYVIFPTVEAMFTTAAGALTGRRGPLP